MTEEAPALQIGELARRANVSLRTVRYYEEAGLLLPAAKTSAGMRLYGETDVVRLRFIRRLKAWGLSLEEIQITLGGRTASEPRAERVHHTLEVLQMEQRRAERRLADMQALCAEVEEALANVLRCGGCDAEQCPSNCVSLSHLL